MKFIISILLMCVTLFVNAQNYNVHWHNEMSDTVRIANLLKEGASKKFTNPRQAVAWYAKQFEGVPYVAHTLEGPEEMLTVNLDEMDCTTFVDVVMALAYTTAERREGWHDFLYNLRRMRYRNGEVDGYGSRLHYNCDWAIDNAHRGNIVDRTRDFESSKYLIRTIDFMSANRDSYSALADSLEYERVKNVENAYKNHRFPYLRTADLNSKAVDRRLKDGDVVAFVSNLKNLDVTHMGILVMADDGRLHVMHASSADGKVELSVEPLASFVKRNPRWIGIRVFGLAIEM